MSIYPECPICNKDRGKRGCFRLKNQRICPTCCAKMRNPECGSCSYFIAAEKYIKSREIVSTDKVNAPEESLDPAQFDFKNDKKTHKLMSDLEKAFKSYKEYDEVSRAFEELNQNHRGLYDEMFKDIDALNKMSFDLFSREEFSHLYFDIETIEHCFEKIGYPPTDNDGERLGRYLRDGVIAVVTEDAREELSRELMRKLPCYVEGKRYQDAWLIHLAAESTLNEKNSTNPFLSQMFVAGLIKWDQNRYGQLETLFKKIGIDRKDIPSLGSLKFEEWVQEKLRNPKAEKILNDYYSRHPEFQDAARAEAYEMLLNAARLAFEGPLDHLLFAEDEISQGVDEICSALNSIQADLREGKISFEKESELQERYGNLITDIVRKNLRNVLTKDRKKELTDQLKSYYQKSAQETGKENMSFIYTAIMSMDAYKDEDNPFLRGLMLKSLKKSIKERCLNNKDGEVDKYYSQAQKYHKQGDFALAIECYKKYLENMPEDFLDIFRVYDNIGEAYLLLGKKLLAEEYLKKSLKKNPRYALAKRHLTLLKTRSVNELFEQGFDQRLQAKVKQIENMPRPEKTPRWDCEKIEEMLTRQIVDYLSSWIPGFSLDGFMDTAKSYVSPQTLADEEYYPIANFPKEDEDFIWMACDELWDRLLPDQPTMEIFVTLLEVKTDYKDKIQRSIWKLHKKRRLADESEDILEWFIQHSIWTVLPKSSQQKVWEQLKNFGEYSVYDGFETCILDLMSGRRYRTIIKFIDWMIQSGIDEPGLIGWKARCLDMLGEKEESEKLFKELLDKNPQDPRLLLQYGIAGLVAHRGGSKKFIEIMEEALKLVDTIVIEEQRAMIDSIYKTIILVAGRYGEQKLCENYRAKYARALRRLEEQEVENIAETERKAENFI